jgi:opacity protein-like surface antigen
VRSSRTSCVAAAVVLTVVAGATAPAFAQTPAASGAPRSQWFIGLGAGPKDPQHGDDYDEGPVALVSFGVTDNRRVRIEGELTRRSHLDRYVSENVFLYGGPTGIHGHADRTELGRQTTDWTVGVNLIGRTGWRRVSLFGGPGAVFHRKALRQYRTVNNCTPSVPNSGGECQEFDNRSTRHGGGLQLMAGVDVHLHSRVTAYVAGRGEYRHGLAMGGVGLVGGVRVVVR